MITNFTLVLMTKNLTQQLSFYQNTLGLDLIFSEHNTAGLGKNKQLYIVLRKELSENSHHLSNNSENKGAAILSFQCQGDINHYSEKIQADGFKIRSQLNIPDQKITYLFVEDYDGNELCLDFSDYLNR